MNCLHEIRFVFGIYNHVEFGWCCFFFKNLKKKNAYLAGREWREKERIYQSLVGHMRASKQRLQHRRLMDELTKVYSLNNFFASLINDRCP